jgi:hypothetical protein
MMVILVMMTLVRLVVKSRAVVMVLSGVGWKSVMTAILIQRMPVHRPVRSLDAVMV